MPPRLAIVHDNGSVTPLQLAVAATGHSELVLLCDPSQATVAKDLPLLREIGTVVEFDAGSPLAEATTRRLETLGIDGITTFSDRTIEATAALAQHLGLAFHSPVTAAALVDKHLQRATLAAAGVPALPRYAAVSAPGDAAAAAAAVGAPAVVKPRQGAGSRNTVLARTVEDCVRTVEELLAAGESELVLEEYLVGDPAVAGPRWGDYVSVESVVVDGRTVQVGITGKPPLLAPFRETGAFFPGSVDDRTAARLTEATEQALRALGVTCGITHTEFKLTAEGPRLIEVNGRLGGFIDDTVGRATGFPMIRTAFDCALGRVPADLTAPAPRRIAFQRFFAPPLAAREIVSMTGVKEAKALPGVRRVEVVRRPGQPVDWREGTQAFAAIVYGEAPDHESLAELFDALDKTLVVTYDRESA
ncbi:ATP-grasp domain-containing protein [Streptomyces olivoreticuli]|uniref:ATP-grasp domain-containing protein n=1 Tax=Streptomyces olivoreticuli TaxID=68246 RepID=UPI000E247F66|nr:ATP-grasp domain-containing protein [Streptomyces olivoreticuli]